MKNILRALQLRSLNLNSTIVKCLLCGHLYNRDLSKEKLGNAFLAVKGQDAPGSRVVSVLTPYLYIPQGLFPWPSLAPYVTSDYIVGHKNTGCSRCALGSPVICISSGLADRLLTSAAVVSRSKTPIPFLISHNLHTLPQDICVLCLFNQPCNHF